MQFNLWEALYLLYNSKQNTTSIKRTAQYFNC